MESRTEREHRAIAAFVSKRLFPAIDEFQSAHDLEISVDSGVFALLAARLVTSGYSPDQVVDTARQMADIAANINSNPPQALGGDVVDSVADNVVTFKHKSSK